MLTKSHEVMRYIKASAGRSSLRVVFEEGNQPRHDGNTIYLPRITTKTTPEMLTEYMASTDHEVAHDLYSDFGILKEKCINPKESPLGFIWNLLEDSRVNALEAKDYEGFRELWDESCPIVLQKVIKNTEEGKGLDQIIRSIIKWDTGISSYLFPLCELLGKTIPTDPKLDEILNKFSTRLQTCQNEYHKVRGSKLTYELARDIFKALGGDPDEEERKAKERKEAAEGKGKDKEGKPGDKIEGDGAGDAIEAKEGDGEGVSEEDWCIKKITISDIEKKLPTVHDIEGSHMSKVGLLYEVTDDSRDWNLTPFEDFLVVDYVNNHSSSSSTQKLLDTTSGFTEWFCSSFNSRVQGKASASKNFAQQVRRLIQIRARSKWEYGVKRGKLDQARLARLALRQPGFSERVFKNKITNNILDASVTILIDMSGSMSGDKVLFATESALLLNHVFQVLQVPLEILGFTDTSKPLMYIYKPFSKPKVSHEELLSYIGCSSAHMTGNPDGEAILWAYDRIKQRKERKRLLLVMSDGQPACSFGNSGLNRFTKDIINEIETQKQVEIYGLGLCDRSVQLYYKHHSTVNEPEEIPHKLLELIEQRLLNNV